MREATARRIGLLFLAIWAMAGGVDAMLGLHTHHVHEHEHHASDAVLALCAPHEDDHEHQLSTLRSPGIPSTRIQVEAPLVAQDFVLRLDPVVRAPFHAVSSPPPRGSPSLHRILLI